MGKNTWFSVFHFRVLPVLEEQKTLQDDEKTSVMQSASYWCLPNPSTAWGIWALTKGSRCAFNLPKVNYGIGILNHPGWFFWCPSVSWWRLNRVLVIESDLHLGFVYFLVLWSCVSYFTLTEPSWTFEDNLCFPFFIIESYWHEQSSLSASTCLEM